jgi:beta-glucosidase
LLFYDHKSTELLDKNFGFQTFNPQWEFGHGLSYSSFSYSNLIIDKKSYQKTDYLKVSVDVKNDSAIDGKEVIQVYITDLIASITPSIKRLRGFKKVKLKAQETQTVHFEIPIESLSFVGKDNKWIVETGDFVIQVDKFKAKFKVK